jgi:hypothetical protein
MENDKVDYHIGQRVNMTNVLADDKDQDGVIIGIVMRRDRKTQCFIVEDDGGSLYIPIEEQLKVFEG